MSEGAAESKSGSGMNFRSWERAEVGALGGQILFLLVAAVSNMGNLNTDAIAYLRIAEYYANWESELMVSGYWGPLLSWLMVPFIKIGWPPMFAARAAMAVSAIVFFFGCRAVFRAFEMDRTQRILGLWIAAIFSVFWSVRHITPDLLLAGLMGLAIAPLMDRRWLESRRLSVLSGAWWGMAYLAKAIAFPLAGLVTLSLAAMCWIARFGGAKKIARSFVLTMAVFGLVAAPWMLVLSLKYGGPTFSTSGKINHAIAGPPDVERYHPFAREFHQPDPGRVTQWEDPSGMDYAFWSPFESAANAKHQAGIVMENLPKVLVYFSGFNVAHLLRTGGNVGPRDLLVLIPGFDLCYLGLAGLIGCLLIRANLRERLAEERWRWAVVPVGLMAGLYLPVYLRSDDLRYFYPAFPFVWVACSGLLAWLPQKFEAHAERILWVGPRLLAGSFGLPAILWLLVSMVGIPNAANSTAMELNLRLPVISARGPIAGSATLQGGRVGLYTAYHLGEAWHGDKPGCAPEEFLDSGAQYVILARFDPRVEAMLADPRFINLDQHLFYDVPPESIPAIVFEIERDSGPQ